MQRGYDDLGCSTSGGRHPGVAGTTTGGSATVRTSVRTLTSVWFTVTGGATTAARHPRPLRGNSRRLTTPPNPILGAPH